MGIFIRVGDGRQERKGMLRDMLVASHEVRVWSEGVVRVFKRRGRPHRRGGGAGGRRVSPPVGGHGANALDGDARRKGPAEPAAARDLLRQVPADRGLGARDGLLETRRRRRLLLAVGRRVRTLHHGGARGAGVRRRGRPLEHGRAVVPDARVVVVELALARAAEARAGDLGRAAAALRAEEGAVRRERGDERAFPHRLEVLARAAQIVGRRRQRPVVAVPAQGDVHLGQGAAREAVVLRAGAEHGRGAQHGRLVGDDALVACGVVVVRERAHAGAVGVLVVLGRRRGRIDERDPEADGADVEPWLDLAAALDAGAAQGVGRGGAFDHGEEGLAGDGETADTVEALGGEVDGRSRGNGLDSCIGSGSTWTWHYTWAVDACVGCRPCVRGEPIGMKVTRRFDTARPLPGNLSPGRVGRRSTPWKRDGCERKWIAARWRAWLEKGGSPWWRSEAHDRARA